MSEEEFRILSCSVAGQAFAMAAAGACVTDEGSRSATSTDLSDAIADAYATAITNLFAEVTDG